MSCSPSLLLNIFFFSYFDWHQPVISLLTFKDSSFVFSTFSFTPTHRILLPKAYVIFYMYSFSSGASCKLMTVSTVFSCHLIPSLNRLCPLPFRFPHPFSPTMTSSYVRALTLLGWLHEFVLCHLSCRSLFICLPKLRSKRPPLTLISTVSSSVWSLSPSYFVNLYFFILIPTWTNVVSPSVSLSPLLPSRSLSSCSNKPSEMFF